MTQKLLFFVEKQEMVATVVQVHSGVPETERLRLPVVAEEVDAKTAITEKITAAGPITEGNPTNLQGPPTTADLKGQSSRLDPLPDPQDPRNPQEITVAITVTIAAITAPTTDDPAALELTDDQMVNWV